MEFSCFFLTDLHRSWESLCLPLKCLSRVLLKDLERLAETQLCAHPGITPAPTPTGREDLSQVLRCFSFLSSQSLSRSMPGWCLAPAGHPPRRCHLCPSAECPSARTGKRSKTNPCAPMPVPRGNSRVSRGPCEAGSGGVREGAAPR